jgi:moderate conductance mechanosensitive channel
MDRIGCVVIFAAKEPGPFDDFPTWFVGVPLRIFAIILGALIFQLVFTWAIRRLVRRTAENARRERLLNDRKAVRTAELTQILMTQRTEQRANAIGTLLTSIVAAIVWGIALLTVLPLLGIDIAPLLASAGVIGVALGFGAQTLVKDYLSGIFIIVEDQYGIGDVVDLGPVVGTVEEVALRYTQVRDLSGVVWYVRNGEILRVANRSQGWTLAIVDIPVPYDVNLGTVRDIVERVSADMDSDPVFDEILLGPPQFAGVESVSGEAMVVRITAKSVPEQQVPLARAIRERVKLAFDRSGIVVPVVMRGMLGEQGRPPGPTMNK